MSDTNKNPWIERPDDPDAAVLGETWAALGNLLEGTRPPFDEAALVAAVQARVARRERWRRRARLGGVGLALAAALLVAVSLVWLRRDGRNVAVAPANGRASGQTDRAASSSTREMVRDNDATTTQDPLLAWDDAELGQSLSSAQQEAQQLESNWRQTTDALVDLQYRLDALQSEIEGSSL